jgi:hypothetical protein
MVAGQLRVLQYRAQIDADGDGLIDSESDGDIPDAVQEKKILCRESPWVPPERKTRLKLKKSWLKRRGMTLHFRLRVVLARYLGINTSEAKILVVNMKGICAKKPK